MEPVPISVQLRCGKCGSSSIVAADKTTEPADNVLLTCAACGTELGRWADIRQRALELTTAEFDQLCKVKAKGSGTIH